MNLLKTCETHTRLGGVICHGRFIFYFFTWTSSLQNCCLLLSWMRWNYVISLKYDQQDATYSPSVYFCKLLYMFQAVPPPIIRSTNLYIQRQALSKQYCCLLLSWMRWNYVISLKYDQQDATYSPSVYFCKLLYMFQAVPPPIIRSTNLYIQRQVLSKQYCCLLLSWMRWNYVPSHQ